MAVTIATLGCVALPDAAAFGATEKPTAPNAVRGTPGNGRAVVSWKKPLQNGGAPIDSYEVFTYRNGHPQPVNVFHSTATTQTILSLTNGKSYAFKVAAHNAAGWSRTSAESPAIEVGVPGVPTGVSAAPGAGAAKVSWVAPAVTSGSPIVGYRVTPHLGATTLATRTFTSAATTRVITGLTSGKTYSFQVAASNARGWGLASVASPDVVVGAPVAPTNVSGVPGVTHATVSWTRPSGNNGSDITAYRVTAYIGSAAKPAVSFNSTATHQVMTGLVDGTVYRFRIEAHNARGWSPRSAPSGPVTPGAPIAPTGVSAVRGSGRATVSWSVPSVNNGSPVGAYEVIPYHSGIALVARVFSTPATSQTITGLVNGVAYTFRVEAHNARGWGPMSAPSVPVTPS